MHPINTKINTMNTGNQTVQIKKIIMNSYTSINNLILRKAKSKQKRIKKKKKIINTQKNKNKKSKINTKIKKKKKKQNKQQT
jgi:hypothetical protein